jgi:predicted nucleic acid-binding protein
MKWILLDTSALYSLIDNRDPDHAQIASFVREIDRSSQLMVTNYVMDEALTLIKARLGAHVAMTVGEKIRSGSFCQLVHLSPEDDEATWQIFRRYVDKDWSYTDCSCLAVMRRLKIEQALATDRHFRQMGITVVP